MEDFVEEENAVKPLKLCYVLSYRSPNYVRTQALVEALKQTPNIHYYEARNTNEGFFRYFQTIWKLLRVRWRHQPHIYVLGFRGHEIYPLLRLIVGQKAIIILDQFVSPYDSFARERKIFSDDSLIAKIIYRIESSILKDANLLLTDTVANAKYYAEMFNLLENKFRVISMSADETLFCPQGDKHNFATNEFIIFTYATFLPLHGMSILLNAAAQLCDLPLRFFVVGGKGQALTDFYHEIEELNLTNITHIKWIDFEKLPLYIRGADLCLGGPFGNTPQARRVITGKTIQFIACGKATIIGKGEENPGFIHQENCLLVPQEDASTLAETIRWAYENRHRLEYIGEGGRQFFQECFSQNSVLETIKALLKSFNIGDS